MEQLDQLETVINDDLNSLERRIEKLEEVDNALLKKVSNLELKAPKTRHAVEGLIFRIIMLFTAFSYWFL